MSLSSRAGKIKTLVEFLVLMETERREGGMEREGGMGEGGMTKREEREREGERERESFDSYSFEKRGGIYCTYEYSAVQ